MCADAVTLRVKQEMSLYGHQKGKNKLIYVYNPENHLKFFVSRPAQLIYDTCWNNCPYLTKSQLRFTKKASRLLVYLSRGMRFQRVKWRAPQMRMRFFCVLYFRRSPQLAVELDHFVRGEEPLLVTIGMIGSRSAYGKAPMRWWHSKTVAVSGSGHTGKQINSFDAFIHMQESPPHKRFLVGYSSPVMRLPEYVTALRAWC